MSLDRSLKSANALVRHRNVLTRGERLERLAAEEKWNENKSPLGLPLVQHLPLRVQRVPPARRVPPPPPPGKLPLVARKALPAPPPPPARPQVRQPRRRSDQESDRATERRSDEGKSLLLPLSLRRFVALSLLTCNNDRSPTSSPPAPTPSMLPASARSLTLRRR